MRKIVINKRGTQLVLSHKARVLIAARKPCGGCVCYFYPFLKRDDPTLISIVEELGKDANAQFSDLKIVKIPSNVKWEVSHDEKGEWVTEKHRTWD